MDKWSLMKRKLFKLLPKQSKPTSIAFTPPNNPNLSPRSVPTTTTSNGSSRGSRSSSHKVSIIPKDAAQRKYTTKSFSAHEPSSPKVSCMGQVKSKKKKKKAQKKNPTTIAESNYVPFSDDQGPKSPNPRGKDFVLEEKVPSIQISPSLGTMKKFASGRGSLSDFDVTLAER